MIKHPRSEKADERPPLRFNLGVDDTTQYGVAHLRRIKNHEYVSMICHPASDFTVRVSQVALRQGQSEGKLATTSY